MLTQAKKGKRGPPPVTSHFSQISRKVVFRVVIQKRRRVCLVSRRETGELERERAASSCCQTRGPKHAGTRRRRRVQRQTQQPTTTPNERVPCANGKAFRASLDNMRRNAKCQHVCMAASLPPICMRAIPPLRTRILRLRACTSRISRKNTGRTYWCRCPLLFLLGACVFPRRASFPPRGPNKRGRSLFFRSETAVVSSIRAWNLSNCSLGIFVNESPSYLLHRVAFLENSGNGIVSGLRENSKDLLNILSLRVN